MEETTEFAFGDNEIDGKSCPMVTAQLSGRDLTIVAEEYDRVVRQRYGVSEGTLPKSVAASCWNDAIDSVRHSMNISSDPKERVELSRSIEKAEEVARMVF